MHASSVMFDEMRSKMRSVDQLREVLGATEPLGQYTFPLGTTTRFHLQPGWESQANLNTPVPCFMDTPGGERYQLTRQTVLEAGALAGIPRKYAERLPLHLHGAELDYWFSGLAGSNSSVPNEVKVLFRAPAEGEQHPVALGLARATIVPYSNLSMLDAVIQGIKAKYGQDTELLVDYKLGHSLERTDFRLVVPGKSRVIQGTRVADDTWCTGISVRNSLTGLKQPRVDGYLFRYWCTNGSIDTMATAGALARRAISGPDEAYEWARSSVDEVLTGLEDSLDHVQDLAGIVVVGSNDPDGSRRLQTVLTDLFNEMNIPVRERSRIIAAIAEIGGEITMYDIMQAITATANVTDGSLSSRSVESIMTLGGHTIHAAHDRCGSCFRMLPEGWAASVATAALEGGVQPSAS